MKTEKQHRDAETKRCNGCRVIKDWDKFHKGGGLFKLHSLCKKCRSLSRKGTAPHQEEVIKFGIDDQDDNPERYYY